jgi:glycosyltransferase involved in cell wall biosynthesis
MLLDRSVDQLAGDARVLRESAALVNNGHVVTIYVRRTSADERAATTPGGARVVLVGPPDAVTRRRISERVKTFVAGGSLRAAVSVARATDIDVVHCHDYPTLRAGVAICERSGAKLVYDSHEIYSRSMAFAGRGGSFRRLPHAARERRLLRLVDETITVGPSCASYFTEAYGVPEPTVVENVPVKRQETTGDARAAMRRKLGVSDSQVLLVSHGLLAPGRGLESLISAMPLLPSHYRLWLLGRGPSEAALRLQISQLDLRDRVVLQPPVPPDDLVEVLTAADAGVVAIQPLCESYRRALPNKAFECIAAGLPMVASDIPELRRLAVTEGLGVTFKPGDSFDLARAIKSLMGEPARVERIRAATVTAHRDHYNWEAVSMKLIAVYGRLDKAKGALQSLAAHG